MTKNQEIMATNIAEIVNRHERYLEALEESDLSKLILLFQESQIMCMSLLADICDDPDMKLKLMESALLCQEQMMPFETKISGI